MINRFLFSSALAGTVATAGCLLAAPANALSFFGDGVTIDGIGDVGQSFVVNFNGNVNEQNVAELTSQAIFTLQSFGLNAGNTEAVFNVVLNNTSSSPITASRVSALGFNTDPNLVGVGNNNNSGRTRVSGIFTNDHSGAFPNNFGDIDVCFTNGNTCQGGAGGGVTLGNSGSFSPILAFAGNISSFTLNNFGVRYQSIEGTNSINGTNFRDASGTGQGSVAAIPTPALPLKYIFLI